jgi:hypothetical protein
MSNGIDVPYPPLAVKRRAAAEGALTAVSEAASAALTIAFFSIDITISFSEKLARTDLSVPPVGAATISRKRFPYHVYFCHMIQGRLSSQPARQLLDL